MIYQMETCVRQQEKAMEEKLSKEFAESSRDKVKEQKEAAKRLKRQNIKASAILKFENALCSLTSRSLKTATVKVLNSVQTPIFNKRVADMLKIEQSEAEQSSASSNNGSLSKRESKD